ncbi:MAG: hypothetical protein DWP92_09740 [Armatimonadetes bacterium]|nr:MAG: hypothetical protein DWP92_09740 [Armatimonadota bacterium]
MLTRLRTLGIVVAVIGVLFLFGGGYAYMQVQAGYDSLQSFSEAQNVTLSYNEDGQLIDRGTTEGAEAIMSVLVDDWNYPVNEADFDPNDPLVNTATEYMYQMATIGYHTLHGTQTVVLDETVEYNGETFPAGTYEVVVNEVGSPERVAAGLGGYWTDFDRSHPLEGPARSQAWSGTAHALYGELGVGTVTASTLQLGLGVTALLLGLGLTFGFVGLGMVWVSRGKRNDLVPETVPETWVPQDSTV